MNVKGMTWMVLFSVENSNLSSTLFDEIKDLLKQFNNFKVNQEGRVGNIVAHKLARHAQYVDDMVICWPSTTDLNKQYMLMRCWILNRNLDRLPF